MAFKHIPECLEQRVKLKELWHVAEKSIEKFFTDFSKKNLSKLVKFILIF